MSVGKFSLTETSSPGVVEPIVSGLFNPLSSLFIGMMKQDGRHSPEEAIPIVNGEVTEPSSAGVVEPIVSALFSIYRNDESRWPAQSRGSNTYCKW